MTYLLDVMCIVKIQSVTTGTRSTTGCLQATSRMTAVIMSLAPPPSPYNNTPDEPLSSPLDKQPSALSNVGWRVDPRVWLKSSFTTRQGTAAQVDEDRHANLHFFSIFI